ncbi:Protein priA [Vanrija pseudolonga]|uniref:Protein priA n=1 Tax=Vanrija pseudolonga TaxID=143232 RepID=A0AAF1BNK5_9TREE|nr:Protein priA [Vanrija pseudolonga]
MRRVWLLHRILVVVLLLGPRVVGQSSASTQTFYGCYSSASAPAYNLYSSFVFFGCTASLTLNPADGLAGGVRGPMTATACWAGCAGFLYAYLQGTPEPTFNCFCANNQPFTSGVGLSCGPSSFYMYSHTPAQAASHLARRKQRLLQIDAERVLVDNPYCPVGLESCRVYPDLRDESYECIRTDTELESCGGCRYGRYGPGATNMTTAPGVDCTALPGVRFGAVTCRQGQCVISGCRYGFRLRNNACLPTTQAKVRSV